MRRLDFLLIVGCIDSRRYTEELGAIQGGYGAGWAGLGEVRFYKSRRILADKGAMSIIFRADCLGACEPYYQCY